MKYIKLFENFIIESVGEQGLEYEKKIHDALNAAGIDGLDTGDKPGAGFSNQGAGDLELKLNGKAFNVEVKLDSSAQMGGTSFKYDYKTGQFTPNKELPAEILGMMMKAIKSKEGDIRAYIEAANQLHAASNPKVDYKADGIPIKVSVKVRDILKSKGFLKKINVAIPAGMDFLIKHYNDKGVYYINIGGKGLFYVGKNPLGLPVPPLKGQMQIEIRLAFAGGKVQFNTEPKPTPARNASIRAQARLLKFKGQSPYNLDDVESIKKVFDDMKK